MKLKWYTDRGKNRQLKRKILFPISSDRLWNFFFLLAFGEKAFLKEHYYVVESWSWQCSDHTSILWWQITGVRTAQSCVCSSGPSAIQILPVHNPDSVRTKGCFLTLVRREKPTQSLFKFTDKQPVLMYQVDVDVVFLFACWNN